jgi:hypothetical protein
MTCDKCEDVTLYDDGHHCKRCYDMFVPKSQLDELQVKLDLVMSSMKIERPQIACWKDHPNITCGCPSCRPVKETES